VIKGDSVKMGDVNFNDRIENNQGVISGHIYSTAGDGVRVIGSSVRQFFQFTHIFVD